MDKILEVPKNLFTPKCTMAICWLFLHLIPSTVRTLMTCHQILVEKIRSSGLFQSVKWSQLTNKKRPVQKNMCEGVVIEIVATHAKIVV